MVAGPGTWTNKSRKTTHLWNSSTCTQKYYRDFQRNRATTLKENGFCGDPGATTSLPLHHVISSQPRHTTHRQPHRRRPILPPPCRASPCDPGSVPSPSGPPPVAPLPAARGGSSPSETTSIAPPPLRGDVSAAGSSSSGMDAPVRGLARRSRKRRAPRASTGTSARTPAAKKIRWTPAATAQLLGLRSESSERQLALMSTNRTKKLGQSTLGGRPCSTTPMRHRLLKAPR